MINKIALIADETDAATSGYKALKKQHDLIDNPEEADAIIVLGGDGFMLHSLHRFLAFNKPLFGMNCGSVGFLMNAFGVDNLLERIQDAQPTTLHPLEMHTRSCTGKESKHLAFNEVSLLRETRQAARLKIDIDGKNRVDDMVGDGILVSTSAGSTAYNFSVQGPIIPLGSNLLALTPISPFRPRRWRGALLPHTVKVEIEILNPQKRPVGAVADFTEIRDVCHVSICERRNTSVTLLFDTDHSLEERIIREQFLA